MDGSEGPSARSARTFAERLGAVLNTPVDLFDERLTSFEAEDRLKGAGVSRKMQKGAIDAVAATVILEGWLAMRNDGDRR
jgi:putative Holliday junction resolvase